MWNPNAVFKYYEAISVALGDKKIYEYSQIGGNDQVKTVTTFVEGTNGGNIRERWYLPNTTELELIYSRVGALEKNEFFAEPSSPNDNNSMGPKLSQKLSGRLFWTCEVKETDANSYDKNAEHFAEYVSFVSSDSGTKEADKNSPKDAQNQSPLTIDVIAVSNFKYSSF